MCSGCLDSIRRTLADVLERVSGLSARAIINYVLYELEHGSDPCTVLNEAMRLAEEDLRDLTNVIDILKGGKGGAGCGDPAPHDR